MAFKAWMVSQDWRGKEIDKDLLLRGNKVYGPDTCVFLTHTVNSFLIDKRVNNGELPTGVSLQPNGGMQARCQNPLTGKREHLGMFTCPHEAHEAWRKRKHELALLLAEDETDFRIVAALSTRYQKGTDHA